jgi:hypothetical protein
MSATAKRREPRGRFFLSSPLTIVEVMSHPGLFLKWFEGESWDGWRTVLKAAFALPMSKGERAFFRTVAERDPPRHRVKELWIVAGRRAGKDSIASLIAAYSALLFRVGYDKLRPGEKAVVQCLACDRDQAKIVLNYVRSFFDHIPPLRGMVTRRTATGLELQNDVSIEVATNSFKAVRGRSFLLSILDEVAYYQDETSARPDIETYNAVKPGLATLPGAMLVGISSPYRKAGLLHAKYKRHFGVDDDDVLVVKAPSLVLNPTLDRAIIDKAYEDDPQVARAEWGAEFRDDISGFVDADVVAACVSPGTRELPPMRGVRYFGFVDPSGGSSDSMTLAIAHREGDRVIVDAIRERRPPFSPDDCVIEQAATLRSYGVGTVQGDRYAGEWPRERFAAHGIRYEPCEQPKSALYQALLPALNAKRVELLDIPRLVTQLCSLERRTARGGRDSIDHPPGGHDDLANVIAGAVVAALQPSFFITAEVAADLIARIDAMPPRRGFEIFARRHFFRPPPAQRGYPQSLLPPERRSPPDEAAN